MGPKDAERMADFFDARSQGYEAHMERSVGSFAGFYTAIASAIAKTEAAVEILDIGCGTGLELEGVLGRAPNAAIRAVDVSSGMLDKLRAKYSGWADQIDVLKGSYLEMDLGEWRYDYALAVMTLHHLLPSMKRKLYVRLRRALKQGGTYIEGDWIVSPEEEERYLASYAARVGDLEPAPEGGYHIDIPSSSETVKGLLLQGGFSDVEVIWEAEGNSVYVARK